MASCQIDRPELPEVYQDPDQGPYQGPGGQCLQGLSMPAGLAWHAVSPHQPAPPTRTGRFNDDDAALSGIKDKAVLYPEVIGRISELPLPGELYTHNDVQVPICSMASLANQFAAHWSQGNSMPLPGGQRGVGNSQTFGLYAPLHNAFLCSETLQYRPPNETPKPWRFVAGEIDACGVEPPHPAVDCTYTATMQAENEDTTTKAKIRWEQGTPTLLSVEVRTKDRHLGATTDVVAVERTPVQFFIKPQRAALTRELCKEDSGCFFFLHKGSGKIVALRPVVEQLLRRGSNFEALAKELAAAMLNESVLENLADAEKFEQRLLKSAGLPEADRAPPHVMEPELPPPAVPLTTAVWDDEGPRKRLATEPDLPGAKRRRQASGGSEEPEIPPPSGLIWADDEGEMDFQDTAWLS